THTDPDCLCREPIKSSVITVPAAAVINEVRILFTDVVSFSVLQTKLKVVADDMLADDKTPKLVILTAYYDHTKPDIRKSYISLVRLCAAVLIFMKIPESEIRIQAIDDAQRSELLVQEVNKGKLQAGNEHVCCGPQVSPGHVLMVPIANLKNRNGINPLQPKTSRRTMLEMESY